MQFSVSVDTSGLDATLDALRAQRYRNVAAQQIGSFALKHVRQLTPGKGVVRAMWNPQYHADDKGRIDTIIIYNTWSGEPKELIRFLEKGTKPHVIEPKPENRRQRLVFFWPVVSRMVFARKVHHPGTVPYRMVELTEAVLETNMRHFEASFAAALTRGLE